MPLFVGLDIGGTKLLVAAADETGMIVRRVRRDTPRDLDEGLAALHAMIGEVAANEPIAGIGAAAGGPLDWERGVVSPLHQPEWRAVPLKAIMEQRYRCPFYVDVDTNVAALGEYYGSDDRPAHMLYITVSTGMGGGFLVNGQVYRGGAGAHPEVAHQSIAFRCAHPERIICDCGAPDCVEALVSGSGIRRVYRKPAEQLNADEWAEVGFNLGQGLRNAAALYAPDVIVLGGGVAVGGGEPLLDHARQVLRERLLLVPVPEIRLSHLGYETALRGTLEIARRGL